ncbi:pilus assembly protein [Pseudorhodoferax sp. Leaf267]|uniref:pilus assembly protein n=1 Tax=Pseudorhodoferax sp. Leaf267 TaxID=1736316 RepID=UPI0006F3E0C7|nr:PilC/PilY family type IV pilus protein [Pseudorhodoferax sp. Leaf267]KQP14360.1 hypothetical protein ASF43_16245 [Pseudorhodoferax sp. Leaf267]
MTAPRFLHALALLVACSSAGAEPLSVAIAAESSSLLGHPRVFVARHDPQTRAGDVVAQRAADDDTALWSAARMLDTRSEAEIADRLVLTADAGQVGTALQWADLPPGLRETLSMQGLDAQGLAYLRGDRRAEGAHGFRPRASRLGAIVNANVWFVGRRGSARKAMVFVGANDGMLHGFDADDGREKIAYVPRGVLPRLAALTAAAAADRPTVDGPVFAGDAPVGEHGAKKTVLVGALGAGGNGFYLLDISDPERFTAANAASTVLVDLTDSADPDLGQIFAPPVVDEADPNRSRQVVQLNNRRWAAVMGNGYFSASGRPVLLIQYLDGARELHRLSPCAAAPSCAVAGDNGLSAPRLIDVNGDGMVDLAYAGDLQGHLWKFDLSGRNDGEGGAAWRVAFDGQPFFIARDAEGRRQPMTTAPYWMPHPQGGVMLAVGTGRNLQRSDGPSRNVQSIYGLHDDSALAVRAGAVQITDGQPLVGTAARPATLVQQRYTHQSTVDGTAYYGASRVAVSYTGTDRHRGWWIDMPLAGQRVLLHPRSFEGQKILVHTVVPTPWAAASPAVPWNAGTAYLSVLNLLTGQPAAQPAFAVADAGVDASAIGMVSTAPGPALLFRRPEQTQLRHPASPAMVLRNSKTVGARAGWRERP